MPGRVGGGQGLGLFGLRLDDSGRDCGAAAGRQIGIYSFESLPDSDHAPVQLAAGEFVVAVADNHVMLAHPGGYGLGDLGQDPVLGLVAERVVCVFEAVDVDEDQDGRLSPVRLALGTSRSGSLFPGPRT